MKTKFKLGDVVKTKDDAKGVIVDLETFAIGEGPPSYKIVNEENHTIGVWYAEGELEATKRTPWTVATGMRKDRDGDTDYRFVLVAAGKKRYLSAGCRTFLSTEDALAHWRNETGYYGDYYEEMNDYRADLNKRSIALVKRLERKVEA
jgi:hypothetical protein